MSKQIANLELYILQVNYVVWDPNPAGGRRGETETSATRSSAVRSFHTNDSKDFYITVTYR